MPRTWRYPCVVALAAGLIFFTQLGSARLWDRDEPRNAGAAREMLERGDWVVPVFNGELRGHKPALHYWFIMAAYQLLGESEFSARFFSALFGIGTALLAYELGRMLFSRRVGLWSGVALATSLNFGVVARAATPDSIFLFFATLSLVVLVWGMRHDLHLHDGDPLPPVLPRGSFSRGTWSLAYIVMGFAVLAKGLIGFLLPTAIVGVFLLYATVPQASPPDGSAPGITARMRAWLTPWNPRWIGATTWSMRPWLLAFWILAVAGPWYLAVGLRTGGDFWIAFFGEHHLRRFLQPMEGHGGPLYYYLVAILIGFFPWSCFLIPTWRDAMERTRHAERSQEYRLLLAWVIVYVTFFSLARTKLPSYVLPAYPALAVLTGAYIEHVAAGLSRHSHLWLRIGLACLGGGGIAMFVLGITVATTRLPGVWALGCIGVIPLLGAILAWGALRWRSSREMWPIFAVTSTLLALAVFGLGTARVDRYQTSEELMAFARQSREEVRAIAAFGALEPSWVFYGKQQIVECDSVPSIRAFFQEPRGRFLITSRERWEWLRDELGLPLDVLVEKPKFLKEGTWVVLGLPRSDNAPAQMARLED